MEQITKSAINERAVKIAAIIMARAGICRYDSPMKCRKVFITNEGDCIGCIKRALLREAKKELKREQEAKRQ